MIDLILPSYLFGTIVTGSVLFISIFLFSRGRRELALYQSERALLPDAVRLERLLELKQKGEQEYEELSERLSEARLAVAEREDSEAWLEANRENLLKLKSEREEQEGIRLESVRLLEKLESEQNRLSEFQSQCALAKADAEFMQRMQEQVKTESDELKRENIELAQKQQKIRAKIAEENQKFLDEQKVLRDEQRDKISEENEELRQEQQVLRIEKRALETEVSGLKQETKTKQRELDSLEEQMANRIEQSENEIKQNQLIWESREEQIRDATAKLERLEIKLASTRQEHSGLAAEVHALEREKVALEDLIKNLRADWNTVLRLSGQDEGADERRTQELWAPYVTKPADEFKATETASELSLLSKTDRYLKGKRLYFPQRVLWAFHTSLKVTDISPLVVLAGISGTGKSELPRRYAEAMGLHFLNVAVQPRWDSPQDMFGFFNYLENRYRATELGRALVQMDPYFDEENRGWTPPEDWEHSLSNQMLLVLLDEMNLARVEYYFSEFLSKLETRRGIQPEDSASRSKAEIALEIGSGKSVSPVMQLFVDRNVLFVGTMNEDETTQALSDKVIDRANVLRFGRPGNIDLNGAAQIELDPNARLEYSQWQEWCRTAEDLSSAVESEVNGFINRLDEAMTQIKRPFGFRTRNGILSYVANYPSTDADAIEDAIADQIEQKILPKFRGLDPRDHDVKSALGKVRSILTDLRDDLLVEAIDATTKESQFIWMGVNRFLEEAQSSR